MGQFKLTKEEQVLDEKFRKAVITEIISPENVNRKNRELRKYEVYKDRAVKWVMESLLKENLKANTLAQMENRAANISICRKIVNKLARCYVGGVTRDATIDGTQPAVDSYEKLLDLDHRMKKSDRYRQLFKNTLVQIVPEKSYKESTDTAPKYKLKLRVYAPYQYDAIEDNDDHEIPRVVILTDFIERNMLQRGMVPGSDGRSNGIGILPNFNEGNRHDEIIADSPEDQGTDKRSFIWWTDNYHFTTNAQGAIIPGLSPDGNENPIHELPFVNIAEEQDGEFWARGGDDLIDGSILVNKLLTDMFSIAFIQGWGQMVITGRAVPQSIEGGPHNAIILEYQPGDPAPTCTFESANPPLDVWMQMIEMYVALLLSTNDLAPSNVSGKLDARTSPSGIAQLVEQSEATQSVEDKQTLFKDVERKAFKIYVKWQNLYEGFNQLVEEFQKIGKIPEDADIIVKFNQVRPVITEAEKLNNLQFRKNLGINTMVDLIMLDNPDMNEEQAEEKLKEIMAERLSRVGQTIDAAVAAGGKSAAPGAPAPVVPVSANPLADGAAAVDEIDDEAAEKSVDEKPEPTAVDMTAND